MQNADILLVLISSLLPLVETMFVAMSCTWKVKDGKHGGMKVSYTEIQQFISGPPRSLQRLGDNKLTEAIN